MGALGPIILNDVQPQNAPNNETRLLTVSEVAVELRVSRSTVYKLILGEKLKTVPIGRAVRIERKELDRFISSLTDPKD